MGVLARSAWRLSWGYTLPTTRGESRVEVNVEFMQVKNREQDGAFNCAISIFIRREVYQSVDGYFLLDEL